MKLREKKLTREFIRQHHGLKDDHFLMTVFLDACASAPGGHTLDFSSSNIAHLLQERFGSFWFAVIFGERKDTRQRNFLFSADRIGFVKYVAASDLHVSASVRIIWSFAR